MTPDQRHYLGRRLHSLFGVIPVGMFLIQHLYGNVLALWGAQTYDEHVHFLLGMPLLVFLEWGLIFLPLALHALLGLHYTFNSKSNTAQYGYMRNWMYWVQRITGLITLAFVIYHLATTRFAFDDAQKASMYAAMKDYYRANAWAVAVYIIGVLAASFHLCNGLWSFCVMWGIAVTRKTQGAVFKGAMLLFLVLGFAGTASALHLGGYWPQSMTFENPKEKLLYDGVVTRAKKVQERARKHYGEEYERRGEALMMERALKHLEDLHKDPATSATRMDQEIDSLNSHVTRLEQAIEADNKPK